MHEGYIGRVLFVFTVMTMIYLSVNEQQGRRYSTCSSLFNISKRHVVFIDKLHDDFDWLKPACLPTNLSFPHAQPETLPRVFLGLAQNIKYYISNANRKKQTNKFTWMLWRSYRLEFVVQSWWSHENTRSDGAFISNTRDRVSTYLETSRRELKIQRALEYFSGTLRCLETW